MKSDWKNCILGDCLQIVKTSVMPKEQTMYSCFSLPAFDNSRTPEILDGKDIKSSKFVLTENTILFNKLNPKFRRIWNVHSLDQTINPIASTEFLPLKVNSNISQDFLYYYISSPSFTALMDGIKTGTSNSQQRIDWRLFLRQPIYLPPSHTQCKIARILTLIDDKIHLNQQINKNLEQQADAIYQSFFSPKSGIQGKKVTLDEYCSIFTGKKNANASVDGGKYKFFTCAPDTLQIDSYIYDGNAIIISGNGAYTGRTRFYSGRFDLYQRTYACTLLDGINPDYIFPLYWFVKLELSKKIMGGTRGSAIPYIVMNDLAKFEFIYSDEMFDTYVPIFKSLTESIHVNELENEHLSNLRDTLLPQLMSGELDVSDINI